MFKKDRSVVLYYLQIYTHVGVIRIKSATMTYASSLKPENVCL